MRLRARGRGELIAARHNAGAESAYGRRVTPHPYLLVADDGPVRTITLNRPQARNAQVPSMWAALAELSRDLPEETRIVVLRGAGDTFSAGLDVAMFKLGGIPGEPDILSRVLSEGQQAVADDIAVMQQGFSCWRQCPAIVIAAVQGYAIGAGFQLALGADLRVVTEDVKFAMKEVSLGLVPDLAGTWPLVHLVGYARALDICATGRFVGAQEAKDLGLATVVAPADGLDKAVGRLVHQLLTLPASSVSAMKPLLAAAVDASYEDQIRRERHTQAGLLAALAAAQA